MGVSENNDSIGNRADPDEADRIAAATSGADYRIVSIACRIRAINAAFRS